MIKELWELLPWKGIEKEHRINSPIHRKYVRTLPCILTEIEGCSVVGHHLLRAHPVKGMGLKSCDVWCVPMNYVIHNKLHANGDEIGFFKQHRLGYDDVKKLALYIALNSPCKKIKAKAKFEGYFIDKEGESHGNT